jgi:hypothetical protein
MRNLILKTSFFFLLLSSCSSSSDNESNTNTNNNNAHLNPPTWIHGSWVQYSSQQINLGGFKFTNNDFCVIAIYGNQISCFGQTFQTPPTEVITSTEYKFSITSAGTTNNYHFIKLSNTQIKFENNDGIERIYTKQ